MPFLFASYIANIQINGLRTVFWYRHECRYHPSRVAHLNKNMGYIPKVPAVLAANQIDNQRIDPPWTYQDFQYQQR